MGTTDSASSIRVAKPWPKNLSNAHTEKVFDTSLFETFVARMVRRHIAAQFLEEDSPVLIEEMRLIALAQEQLRLHLSETVPYWRLNWRICKMIITQHIRKLAEERIEAHDVDDEARDETMECVYREDFEMLWPKDWLDS